MIRRLHKVLVDYVATKLGILLHNLGYAIARKSLPTFANTPQNLFIDLPRRISNPDRITIGNDVSLGPGTLLAATTRYPSAWMGKRNDDRPPQIFDPRIMIGDRVTATAGLQVAAVKEIVIDDDVMFASNVHINDSSHGYDNAMQPYKYQPLTHIAPIRIRRGCWIGQNVVVSPGVTIGEMTIIGANSIVTRDIPARCIAVGAPARVVKQWNETGHCWVNAVTPDTESCPPATETG